MNHRSLITAFAMSVVMAAAFAVEAQSAAQVDPSYDVALQLVIGSNDSNSPKGDLPSSLAAVSKQIRNTMPFANYRLASTFLGRVANSGNFEYKSLSNIFGQEIELRSQTFLEWGLTGLRNLPTAKGGQGFQAQFFRFGAKVPVVTGSGRDEAGKPISVTNFESIGVSLARMGIAENVPTLIGTLNLPGANGTIFLVMTVKSVDF